MNEIEVIKEFMSLQQALAELDITVVHGSFGSLELNRPGYRTAYITSLDEMGGILKCISWI